ncbi:MAG TPA: hypothetical protein DGT23_04150 [Micromonosporaceae bacterium]|nr:hypothetical protein [Micromonosporaceae bacterium]
MNIHIGLSLGHLTVPEAEHWLHEFQGPILMACTHLVRDPLPHVAISLELSSTVDLPEHAHERADARDWHESRSSGRAVIYPGGGRLTGELTVAELLEVSAIEQVKVLGEGFAAPETLVETRDFVRPQWMDGLLTLIATPAGVGHIAPFEIRNPVECCADKH